ncbi:MAG: DUF2191 domain-containing protein [Candidatus Coatesbacteria bacterium]
MRTTLTIPDDLARQVKQQAAATRRTVGQVVADAIRMSLAVRAKTASVSPFKMRTFKGTGVRPGINLDKTSELLEIGDKHHGSS